MNKEKDPSEIISDSLKPNKHCRKAAKKAHKIFFFLTIQTFFSDLIHIERKKGLYGLLFFVILCKTVTHGSN